MSVCIRWKFFLHMRHRIIGATVINQKMVGIVHFLLIDGFNSFD
jgi:hypothetical protein